MKKIIYLFTFLMVLATVPAIAQTASGTCGANGDNLTWKYYEDTQTLVIEGSGAMADYEIIDCDEGTYKTSAPWGNLTFTHVVFPEGITSIGDAAFVFSKLLVSIDLSGCTALESIGVGAFGRCTRLTSIDLSGCTSLKSIGYVAFAYCTSLISADLPGSLIIIWKEAFKECSSLTFVVVRATESPIIDETTFEGVPTSICKLYVPDSSWIYYKYGKYWGVFENIRGMGELSYCGANGDNLTWKYYEDTQTLVIEGSGAMADYDSETNRAPWADKKVTKVVFPKGITHIGSYAFRQCESLISVDLSGCTSLTSIGSSAFRQCVSLTSIDLSGCTSLTSIGSSAFSGCTSLTSVDLSGCTALTSIEIASFFKCTSLISIDLSACTKLKSIGNYAFWVCSSLAAIDLPGSLNNIGFFAFSNCSSLTTMTVRATKLPRIDADPFVYVPTSVCTVYVPDQSVRDYKNDEYWGVFKNIRGLSELVYYGTCGANGDNLTWRYYKDTKTLVIEGSGAMADYKWIDHDGELHLNKTSAPWVDLAFTHVVFPEGITYIGSYAFAWCQLLTSIDLSKCTKLESIGLGAFYYCNRLPSINLSGCTSLTNIMNLAFAYCTSLPSVNLSGCTTLTNIKNGAFAYCTSLTSVNLLGCTSLKSIWLGAFRNCYSLKTINLPNSLESIGEEAFAECSSLNSVDLPSSLKSIGEEAFKECSSLTFMVVRATKPPRFDKTTFEGASTSNCILCVPERSVGDYKNDKYWGVFKNIRNMAEIGYCGANGTNLTWRYYENTGTLVIEGSGVMADYDFKTNRVPWANKKIISVIFPKGITSIGSYAFYLCTSLTSVDLSGCTALTSIGRGAFMNCYSLKSVYLPSSLSYIGSSAFNECTSLTSIDLSACTALSYIGSSAFKYCDSLTSIDLSGCTALTSIGSSAFKLCESLTSIDLSSCISLTSIGKDAFRQCESLTSIDLSECIELKSIGQGAFINCYSLKSVYPPSSLSHIGLFAFDGCNSLSSIDLSACTKLKSIEAFAFGNCYSLRSVYLPSSLESIEYNKVFSSCKSLTFMVLHATRPPTINRNTSSKTFKKVRVYVPDDSLSAYKSSPNWTRSFSDFRPLSKLPKGKRRR